MADDHVHHRHHHHHHHGNNEDLTLPPVPATPPNRHPSRSAIDFKDRSPFVNTTISVNSSAIPSLMKATIRKMSDLVVRASKRGNIVDLESALDAGGVVDHMDSYGFSGLHHCAGKNFVDCMEILIARGADVDIQTKNGVTPLIYAASYNNVIAMNMLIEADADINKTSSTGFTALITAATQHHLEAMHLLLKQHKCNRDATDLGGWTALHHIAQLGHLDSCELLVSQGCIPTVIDFDGVEPYHLALKNGHTSLADFFHNTPGSGKAVCVYGCSKAPYMSAQDMNWCLAPYSQLTDVRSLKAKLRKMDKSADPRYNTGVETQVEKDAKWKAKLAKRKERKKKRQAEHAERLEKQAAITKAAELILAAEKLPPNKKR